MAPSAPSTWSEALLYSIELWYGPVLLAIFIALVTINSVMTSSIETLPATTGPGGRPLPATRRKARDSSPSRTNANSVGTAGKFVYAILFILVAVSFVGNFVSAITHTVLESNDKTDENAWWCGDESSVYFIAGLFMHLYVILYFFECSWIPNKPVVAFWCVSTITELVILYANTTRLLGTHQVLKNVSKGIWLTVDGPDSWDRLDLSIAFARAILLLLLCAFYCFVHAVRPKPTRRSGSETGTTDETTPLLGNREASAAQPQPQASDADLEAGQASGNQPAAQEPEEAEEDAFYRPKKVRHKTWFEYLSSYSVFFPYLWPRDSVSIKLSLISCFVILVLQRVVNFLVPDQVGHITGAFGKDSAVPWIEIGLFIFYKALQGDSGLLGSIRSILWIPISQFSYRTLTTAAFAHVHTLSLDFHLSKRTGEVLSALNKGGSINSFLEQVTFQVIPTLIDLLVAIIYFLIRFGAVYSTIAGVIAVYYLHLTVKMASTRADLRRDMVNADREEAAIKNDSITSYETVKYFNAEDRENLRYNEAVKKYQLAEAKVAWGMANMNLCQAFVFMCGILVMLIVAAIEVTQGLRSIGEYVVMITYLNQLQGPLNFFGSFYRTVQQAMISGERLLVLFKIEPSVVDKPDAEVLTECTGDIEWDNVGFSYNKSRSALQGLNFHCRPGTTTAFVGESGGGKSTIFRLMFRYYNCQTGSIKIDGRDVKEYTIDSVRQHIGVVPQDPVLFNETVMYNLKYANPDATDEQVYEACKAASIHDRIMSFSKGYNSIVGDRGTRLSGGEKQRVSIARTILKDPKIIMLDEATSALDSETEQHIQGKLIRGGSLGADRTILIIAHRLSTITHADQIVVLHAGQVAEVGTHASLMKKRGRYANMWETQYRMQLRNAGCTDFDTIAQADTCTCACSECHCRDDENSDGSISPTDTVVGAGSISPMRQDLAY